MTVGGTESVGPNACARPNASQMPIAIAMINATGNLGGYFGPFIVGWIKDSTGKFEAGLYFLAACSLMCAVITYFAARAAGDPAAMLRANAAAAAE